MKKILLLSTVALVTMAFLSSCVRNVNSNGNENYWLTQERGDVVYSDSYCGYYVVETDYGYTVMRAVSSRPFDGSVMYGDFAGYGVRDFYNYTSGVVIRAEVIEYDLTYTEAQYAVDYYCPYGKANGGGIITRSPDAESKAKRIESQEQQ